MQVSSSLSSHTPQSNTSHSQPKRHMKIKIPRSQAKVVSDAEMQALLVEAAAKCFYSHIALTQDSTPVARNIE